FMGSTDQQEERYAHEQDDDRHPEMHIRADSFKEGTTHRSGGLDPGQFQGLPAKYCGTGAFARRIELATGINAKSYWISVSFTGRRSSQDFRAARPMTTGMRPSRPLTAVGRFSTTDRTNERTSLAKLSV